MGSNINTSRRLGGEGKGKRMHRFPSLRWLLFSVVFFVVLRSAASDDTSLSGLDYNYEIVLYIVAGASILLIIGVLYICCRHHLEKFGIARRCPIPDDLSSIDRDVESNTRTSDAASSSATFCITFPTEMGEPPRGETISDVEMGGSLKTGETSDSTPEPPKTVEYPSRRHMEQSNSSLSKSSLTGSAAGIAAAGTAGLAIAGTMAVGWNVVGLLAENLPWIGVAYNLLNEIIEIVDTKNGMKGNMEKIKKWAVNLQDVIVSMAKQMKKHPATNARALENMSRDVIGELQELVNIVASYDQRGTLAQYAASRSCQKAVDAADTALRGALTKLAVGQGAEIMTMVGNLQDAGLVVDEKLDMIIEHLRKQEEHTARLELRLAEYSESIAEVLGNMSFRKGQQPPTPGKNLRELGKETLDKLQISNEDITYPSNLPFASGTFSEVYQVVHEGVVKAAKKTNLARLGVGRHGVDRVFKRFVKELYILSQMHSERVVSVYGAIASPTELTLIMEFLERGSLRSILDDDNQRAMMTPEVKHGILEDTAGGMTYLYHMGVEHRDLKCANCLVTHDWRVKITDFGLSRTTDAISTGSASTVSSVFRGGTMVYMAPELLPGGTGADRRITAELSDVYSFGIITWEVLCGEGRMPWNSERLDCLPLTLKMGKKLEIPEDCSRFYRKLMMNCWRAEPHRRPTFERILKVLKKNPCGGVDRPQSPSPARPCPLNLPTRKKSLPRAEFPRIGLRALEDGSSSDGDEETGHSTSSSHPHRNTSSSSLERVRPRHPKVSRTPTRKDQRLPKRPSRSPVGRRSKSRETPSRWPAGRKKERDRRTPSRSPIVRRRRDHPFRPDAPPRSPAHQRDDSCGTPSRARVDMMKRSYHPDGTPGELEQPLRQDLGHPSCLEMCPPAGSNRKAHARHESAPAGTTGEEYLGITKGLKRRSASTLGGKQYSLEESGGGIKAAPEPRLPSTTWAAIPIGIVATTPQFLPALSETEGDVAAGYSTWNWKKPLAPSAEEVGSSLKSASTAPPSDPQEQVTSRASASPPFLDNDEVSSGTGSGSGPLVGNGAVDTTPSTESKKTPGRQRRNIPPDHLTTPSRIVTPGKKGRDDHEGNMLVTSPGPSVESSTESESMIENRGLGAPYGASLQPHSPLKGSDALTAWFGKRSPSVSYSLEVSGTSNNSNPCRRRTALWRGEIVELPPSVEHPEEQCAANKQKGGDEGVTSRTQSLNVTETAGRNRGLYSQPGMQRLAVETRCGRRSASMDDSVTVKNGEGAAPQGHRVTRSNDDACRVKMGLTCTSTAPALVVAYEKNNGEEEEEEVADDNGKIEGRRPFRQNVTSGRVSDRKAMNGRKGSSGEGKLAVRDKKRPPSVEFVHGFRPIDTSDR